MTIQLKNRKTLVVGLGRSGISCCRFLLEQGAVVTAADESDEVLKNQNIVELQNQGVHLVAGKHPDHLFQQTDLIVLSPGVPHRLAPIQQAQSCGVPVMGEIELAAQFIQEPIVAITGTNGKTTTTTLIGEMLRKSGKNVFVGGNIGTPLIDYVIKREKAACLVVEISSFQLDTIHTFRPHVGVLLNVTEDHLDRYPSFQAYGESKTRLFENQDHADAALLDGKDPFVRSLTRSIRSQPFYFTGRKSDESGVDIEENRLIFYRSGQKEGEMDISCARILGRHNQENIAAAALTVQIMGGSNDGIIRALTEFKGLPHRLEHVDTIQGITYVDDSKGTNVDAVVRALESFDVPMVLILGGRGKLGEYSALEQPIRQKVRHLIVMGEMGDFLEKKFKPICGKNLTHVSSMEEAVHRSHEAARPGDVVLLSPSGSSFDMFRNYAHRGEVFRQCVLQLKD